MLASHPAARQHVYRKWPTLKTWVVELIETPIKAGISTWVTGSARWIKKICVKYSKGETIITIVDRKNEITALISTSGRWTENRSKMKLGES
ncbi:hypothetical protein AYI68_g5003 [Smittium mucronatum]|uniref:Uncharacterized protein n=1 Tax=Smittium mucronatum TaxID=133383 RepID=A0A1R0GVH5_9FUNG|nr:hypothetical protein AYI68_g5003 [Smittium mucronatum]